MSFLESAIKSIGSFLGEGDPADINKKIMQDSPQDTEPKQAALRQPIIEREIADNSDTRIEIRDSSKFIDEDGGAFIPIDVRSEAEIEGSKSQYDENAASRDIINNSLGVTRTKGQALDSYISALKKRENSGNRGLVNIGGQLRFMPFKSVAEKKEPGQSEFEIGYGIKVMDKWLDSREMNWPVIDGVPVDVQEGITPQQADTLLRERALQDRAAVKKEFKNWDSMTEEEKVGWQDLAYNGGVGAINKNPKAKAAANAGFTLEGLVRVFDYNKAGDTRYRGLFTRRINTYNKAALSVTGAPIVEEYKWDANEVWVKFSSNIRSDKFSDKFKQLVAENGGWYKVPGPGAGKPKNGKVGDNFQFA